MTSKYLLIFKGLKDGKHQFTYEIDSDFFADFEVSSVENGKFIVTVDLNKSTTMLKLDFDIKGVFNTICDNCLEDLKVPVDSQSTIFVKFGDRYDEPSEEIIIIPHEDNQIDLKQLIYEFIVLSIPIRNVHPNTGYNNCVGEIAEFLEDNDSTDDSEEIDPRWEVLKNLKENNN